MANLKVRDKPKKKSSKRIVTIFVAMVCLLSIGFLSSVTSFSAISSSPGSSGGSSSQNPGSSSSGNGSNNNGSLISREPNGIEVINSIDFSQEYQYNPEGLKIVANGFGIDERISYGDVNTVNQTLNFSPKSEYVGEMSGAEMSIYFRNDSTSLEPKTLSSDSFDYITFDFDISSETGYMPDIEFRPRGYKDSALSCDAMIRLSYDSDTNSYGLSLYNGTTGEFSDYVSRFSIDDLRDFVHISIVIRRNSLVTPLVEGNVISSLYPLKFDSLFDLNIVIMDHEVKENESIVIDNVCVAAYGNGSGQYSGDLCNLIQISGYPTEEYFIPTIYDCTDWVLYDEFEAERAVYHTIYKELYVPSSGTELSQLSFSKINSSDYDTLRKMNGLRLDGGYSGLLNVSTLNDYLKINSFNSTDSGFSLGFYMLDEANYSNGSSSESKLNFNGYDFITVDFDVWTDSSFFSDMNLKLVGLDSNNKMINEQICTLTDYGTHNILYGQEEKVTHVTLMFETHKSNSYYTMYLFVDGKYCYSSAVGLDNYESLYYVTCWFSKDSIEDRCSVCFDNVQIMGFGNGDNSYSGSLAQIFNSSSSAVVKIELQTISDSVLYNENYSEE